MRTLIASLIGFLLVIGLPGAGWSGSIWFDGDNDEDWEDDDNWRTESGASGQPTSTDSAYITTSDTHGTFSGKADINAFSEVSGALYLGGWPSPFDGPGGHGTAAGKSGVLRLSDTLGDLTLGNGSYIRVGTRGARGHLIQSGGDITTTRAITFGWGGDKSVGIYDLSAGTLSGPGVDVGRNGLGLFTMTGGTFSQSCGGCTSHVGQGYLSSEQTSEGEIPGIGLMVQSGGTFGSAKLILGREAGSVGVLFIQGSANIVPGRLFVGLAGTGSVVQTGGTVSVGSCVEIGSEGGSIGSYTVENGILEQTANSGNTTRCNSQNGAEGLYNGTGGVGTLTVLGDDADIDVVRYVQNAASTLAFMIDEDTVGNAVSTIQVSSTADFEIGAKIRVALPFNLGGVTVPVPTTLDLLTATQGITGIADASDLVLVGPDAANWSLSIVNGSGSEQTLVATAAVP